MTATPFLTVPADVLPKPKTHPVHKAAAALATASDLRAKAAEALDVAESSTEDLLTAWEKDRREAVARIAAGEAVTVAARPSEADAADRVDTARRVLAQAEKTEADAVQAYDRAVRENLADVLPTVTERMHREADEALSLVEAARSALSRALASRGLALGLRASEAYTALVASGTTERADLVPIPGQPGIVRSAGTLSVRDQAERHTAEVYALAPPISETAAALDAIATALAAMGEENPSEAWDADRTPRHLAEALGLEVAPAPAPAPLETREEWNARHRRAIADRDTPPLLPAHLGGLV
jgi:hypothetical protein